MEIRLGDYESDCFTNLRFADDVLLFSSSVVQLQKMMCDSKQSTESVGLKIHPYKTKILSNQSTNTRKEVEISSINVEILPSGESAKYLWQTNYVSATGNSRDQKSNQSRLGFVLQIHTRADVKIVFPSAQIPPIQYGDHADAELCIMKGTR